MEENAYKRARQVIEEATEALALLEQIDASLWNRVCTCLNERTGKIILTGVGKSGYIAMKLAATLTSLGQFATFVHPVEAMHGDSGIVQGGDIVIALSFSGSTKELVQFLRHIREVCPVTLIGITGKADSDLAKLSDHVVPVNIREEGSPHNLAPMASTTAMLVVGDALAAGLASPESFTKHDFARFHPSGNLGISLTHVHEKMLPQSAEDMVLEDTPLQHVLVQMSNIGKGLIGVVAVDGTLKGAISDGDVRRFFLSNTSIEGALAKDAMSVDPKCIQREHTLKDALTVMEDAKITNVFIVDADGSPIGILHLHDILSS